MKLLGGTDPLFASWYFDNPGYEGGTTEFHRLCERCAVPGARILEIGAGPSNQTSDFLATLGVVVGVDVSKEVFGNGALAECYVYDGHVLPFRDANFDLCVSNYVVEHVEDAMSHFREVARVLRPSGFYVFRTPNLLHYVTLASRVLPHRLHSLLANRLRGLGDESHEPWPTHYHANTPRSIRRLAEAAGFEARDLRLVEKEPSYARASALLFYPMMMYERMVNSTERLASLRSNIFAALRKPA